MNRRARLHLRVEGAVIQAGERAMRCGQVIAGRSQIRVHVSSRERRRCRASTRRIAFFMRRDDSREEETWRLSEFAGGANKCAVMRGP